MRFAIIDWLDCIAFESDDLLECCEVREMLSVCDNISYKGIFDYEQNMYLDECDILDLVGCQIHDNENIGENKKMLITVKCWKTKNGKVCKALCYVDKNGREQIATFDKWFIGALLGTMGAYYRLNVGDSIDFYVDETSDLPDVIERSVV